MKKINKVILTLSAFACFAVVACGQKDAKSVHADVPAKLQVLSAQCKNNLLEISYKKNNEFCNASAEYSAKTLTKIKAAFILSATGAPPVFDPLNPSTPSTPGNPSNPSTPVNPSSPSTPVNPSTPSTPVNPSTPSTPANPSNPSSALSAVASPSLSVDKNTFLKVTVTVDKYNAIVGIDGEADGVKLVYNNASDLKDLKVKAMYEKCFELVSQLKTASKKCEAR